jgi:hypothetical protein
MLRIRKGTWLIPVNNVSLLQRFGIAWIGYDALESDPGGKETQMVGRGRRPVGRLRPGMTLAELLGAIALLGVTGALLLPRLAPARPRVEAATTWSCPAAQALMCSQTQGSFIGIGAVLDSDRTSDGYVRIVETLPNGPAEQMGVLANDLIVAVDGVSAQNMDAAEVTQRIRGDEVGTPVRLTLGRGAGEILEITLLRQHIFAPE